MKPALIAFLLLAAAGCTSEQLYNSAQGWREAECNKILDTPRRERCMKEAARSHDSYQKRD
jgi:hypothetical protein